MRPATGDAGAHGAARVTTSREESRDGVDAAKTGENPALSRNGTAPVTGGEPGRLPYADVTVLG